MNVPGPSQSALIAEPDVGNAAVTTATIFGGGLVAILRAPSAEHFIRITEILVTAGIRAIEVTLTAPDAIAAIEQLTGEFHGPAVIGAGTVVTADQAEACIAAGAAFVVSPTASPDVTATARIAGVAAYPGALTPTEILAAHQGGAAAIKLFPASAVGPRFITDLHGPFPEIPIMPTGGIAIDDIVGWLHAGAAAVGLGSPLIGAAAVDGVDRRLADRARRAVAAVAAARTGR